MLKAILLQVFGTVLAILPALYALFRIARGKGLSKAMTVKERSLPPARLHDPKWGEHKYIHIPDIRVHYVEKGDHDKPLMVFLHGFPEFWYSWRHQLDYFADHFWCVAPDGRGYGDTDKPTGINEYQIDKLADDVKNLVHALGRKECILVGHDWGAGVGYAVCSRHPSLVRTYIVCNMAHPGAFQKSMNDGWTQRLKSWYMIFFQSPRLPEMILKLGDMEGFDMIAAEFKNPETMKPEDVEAYKFAFRDSNAYNGPLNYYRAALQGPTRSLKKVPASIPVLSVFGTGDNYIDVKTAKLSKDFCDDYTENLLDGVSHWVMIDAYKEVNKSIENFLGARGFL